VNKVTGKTAIIISDNAAGMCKNTLGVTLVIYRYEGDTQKYPFFMEHLEFYKKNDEVKQLKKSKS